MIISKGLTRKRLDELLGYDPETGVWRWKVSRGSVRAGSIAGHVNNNGYRIIVIDRARYQSSRLAFLYVTGSYPLEADHENRIRDDDRWKNLRDIDRQGNGRNRDVCSNNKSGITGVHFCKQKGRWRARVKVDGDYTHLGYYVEKHNAIIARYCGELRCNWSASNSDTPAKQYVDKYLGRC